MNSKIALRAWITPPKNRRFKPYMSYDFVLTSIGEISLYENTEFKYLDNITLMQYTGLLDNQGNRIFEGDIVKRLLDGKQFEIAWAVYGWGLKKGAKVYDMSVGNTGMNEWTTETIGSRLETFKVIGNKYEG